MSILRALGLMVMGGVILLVGSCALISFSTAAAVSSVANSVEEFAESDVAREWEREAEEEALRRHNDQINSESAVDSTFREYDNYEYDNY